MVPVTVVWAYRRTGKFAFHVLTGSLETDPRTAGLPIEFGNGVEAVVAAVKLALARRERVLVGWSFYSPDFAALTKELRAVKARIDDPRVLHVAGGVHATAEPEATLRAGFDLVAMGEGEVMVRDLVQDLREGGDGRSVSGIASLEGGRLRRNGRAARPCSTTSPRSGPSTTASGRSRSRAAASTRAASARRRTSRGPASAIARSRTCGTGSGISWVGVSGTSAS